MIYLTLIHLNEKSKTKPAKGDVVDISGNYMFSFNDEPEENIRVPALMQRVGLATQRLYYYNSLERFVEETVLKGK